MNGAAPQAGPYPLDNHHHAAAAHHRALGRLLDPFTCWRIAGLDDWTGARCLEVGAGGGSIAGWLAELVGPDGQVVATDLKPDHIPPRPGLSTIAYDLAGDTPMADALGGGYDLIHTRLTLGHLPARRAILHRLAGLLAGGGTLLVQDWAALRGQPVVIAAPDAQAAQRYERYHRTAGQVFDSAGTDPAWAPRIHLAMVEQGLVEVATVIHGGYWTGGGPGLAVVAATLPQLRPRLADAGLREAELDQLSGLLGDPGLVVHGHPLYSVAARRP